jgi:putative ABC transport system permease protein
MASFLQDIKFGIRVLLKNPTVTAAALVALVLGIGANTAIFSVVNGVLFRPLPYKDSDNLYTVVGEKRVQGSLRQATTSYPNFQDWKEQNSSFEVLSASTGDEFNLTGMGEPERLLGSQISSDLLPTLRVEPFLGRSFLPQEQQPGNGRVAILSHGLWQRRFASDQSVLGATMTLNDETYTIVGVMPRDFQYPPNSISKSELWVPLIPGDDRGQDNLELVGRLNPGVTAAQAEAELGNIIAGLKQLYPKTNSDQAVKVMALREYIVGDVRSALVILLAAVGLVLLIACANVASLLLARASSRQKEISIRLAMGASRMRLVRQLLTESVLLAGLGGALGLLLTVWGIDVLRSLVPAGTIPRVDEIQVDSRVLGFTLLLAVVTALIFGLIPSLQTSKPDFNECLKEGGRSGTAGGRSQKIRSLLVASEIALSVVLMIAAGLLAKSFLRLSNVDPGFKSENRLTMRIDLPPSKYREPERRLAFYNQLMEQLGGLPGVQSIGVVNSMPFAEGNSRESFNIEGRPNPRPEDLRSAEFRVNNADYFKTLGIPVVEGRPFNESETRDSMKVAIINETMANALWPGQSPIGKRLLITFENKVPREIVGLVRDVKHTGLTVDAKPQMYIPYVQRPGLGMYVALHTNSTSATAVASMRNAVYAVDSDQPIYNIKTMDQWLARSVATNRFNMLLLIIFGSVALCLSVIGIYGVISYSVNQRTREIGIRMALGAQRKHVIRMVILQGMKPVVIGVALGVGVALYVTRVLSELLYTVTPSDLLTFVLIPWIFTSVALAATLIPAWRATKVDPTTALRHE